jgi:hypothetical protein
MAAIELGEGEDGYAFIDRLGVALAGKFKLLTIVS